MYIHTSNYSRTKERHGPAGAGDGPFPALRHGAMTTNIVTQAIHDKARPETAVK